MDRRVFAQILTPWQCCFGLQEALHGLQLDANYTEGTGTLRGILSVSPEAAQQTATVFDLGKAADRLFAIELASTWRAVADATTEQARR